MRSRWFWPVMVISLALAGQGNLLPGLISSCRRGRSILPETGLFSMNMNWNGNGELYRIDHLRVNKEKKEILILDYKSGITREQAQLDRYKEIIEEMTGGEYEIRTEFVEI